MSRNFQRLDVTQLGTVELVATSSLECWVGRALDNITVIFSWVWWGERANEPGPFANEGMLNLGASKHEPSKPILLQVSCLDSTQSLAIPSESELKLNYTEPSQIITTT